MHLTLLGGSVLIACAFFVVSRLRGPLLETSPQTSVWIALGFALASLTVTAVAFILARGRIPRRVPSQSLADYWEAGEVRGPALVFWVCLQGAATIGLVGFVLAGSPYPLGAALLAIAGLTLFGPSRLAGE
jgi:hypothetical protein